MSYAIGIELQRAYAGLVSGRVYPVRLDDAPVYPCIRYTNVTTNYHNTLCGPANITDARYRVDVFATTVKECEQIAASIRAIMRGGSFAFENTPLMDMDGYEPTVGIYRKTLDFTIWEAEAMFDPSSTRTRATHDGGVRVTHDGNVRAVSGAVRTR